MLARNLLNSFIFTCCLIVGSMASADVVKLNCTSELGDERTLQFDKANRRAQFASWPWADIVHWDKDKIVWAAYSKYATNGAGFMFHRKKSMLQIKVISYERDFPEYPTFDGVTKARRCTLGF